MRMSNKFQNIRDLSLEMAKEITNSNNSWLKFLDTASNNYKYSFQNQVLIYAQKPDAIACADINTWNNRLHRWIKKGAKGIATIENDGINNRIKYIFDISDTYDKFGRNVDIWQVNHNNDKEIIDDLESTFGELELKDNLPNAIISLSFNIVEDNIQDYLKDTDKIDYDNFLEDLKDKDIQDNFKILVSYSVAYVILKRCGINPMQYLEEFNFEQIVNFNSIGTISRIGAATNEIARIGLQEIYKTNKFLNEKNYTFDNKRNKNYNKDNESNIEKQMQEVANDFNLKEIIEKQENNERSKEYENNISQRWRLPGTRPSVRKTGESESRNVWKSKDEILEGTQEGNLDRNDNDRNINKTSSGDRQISEFKSEGNSSEISKTKSSERGIESQRSNALGTRNEQFQESGRRNSLSRVNLQLNFFEDNISQSKQIKHIDEKNNSNILKNIAEVENTPAFSFTQEMFDDALKRGSGFEKGKFRIYREFQNSLSIKETADFLKNEYGIGGTSSIPNFEEISMWSDSKGITLRNGYTEDSKEKTYTWNQVAQRLNELIKQNQYLDDKEMQEYSNWIKNEENTNNFKNINESTSVDENKSSNSMPKKEKLNYHIIDNNLGEGTPKEKVRRNIEAIKLLHKLEDENRLANSDEQEILAKYVGWGGLPDVFDENKTNWTEEYKELKEILTDDEYKSARASTLTAFYTPPIVIKSIYKLLQNMGLEQANILEPSCGTGNFLGMLPQELNKSKLYGVELDSISGRIAKQLYQNANIQVKGYEKTDLPDSFFDVAIGNVPFGDFKVIDRKYDKNNFLIHDYFFAKTLDKIRPGGIIAFVTSKGTLDKENPVVRKYIAQRAELLGAIRLPDNTFTKNAGTKVTSDIIFLQKRENLTDIMPDWVYLDKDENNITMNKYFVDNPDMILGKMEMVSTAFGYDSTCKAIDGQNLEESLNYAITNIHGELQDYAVENEIETEDTSIPALPNVKNFSYAVIDGNLYFRENSKMILQNDLPLTTQNRIKGLIKLREQVRELIDLQMNDVSDEDIHISQAKLNELYDNFSKEYGLINSRANENAFSNDNSYFLLCSLEKLDSEGKFIGKADMFSKRTIKAKKEITEVDTSDEALILSIQEKAKVDLDYMSKLTRKDKETIINELSGLIFKVPLSDNNEKHEFEYQIADEYLSGNVREKLRIAESQLETHPEYKINVDRLKEVVPKDLSASEIEVKLGATWIPPKIIEQFIFELLDTPGYKQWNINVKYSNITAEWYIEGKGSDKDNVKAYSTYGTTRINAYKIIENTLNLKDVKIFDTIINDEGQKQRVLNRKETAIASSKQDMIKEEFSNWLWKDPERRNQLVRLYNDKFNSIIPREYDGSHIDFVGMNPEIHLRKHQLNAVAHILYGNNVLLAHEVGAGKTFEMVAGAMESKRLGLCNKSLFVVPNHIIEQFASEFLQLYPSANILVATKKDFETKNRKKFCSRIATGDFDAVIIGHSQFEKIPMSIGRQEDILMEQIEDITRGIAKEKENKGENYTIKQMEKTKRVLEQKLEKLIKQERKDDVVTFEELGVDKLFVDEAHNFKNLFLYTKMGNVSGISQTEAQKSTDLYMKCRYLDEITGGKGIVFATGTPVSNSMAELYTMQRYLQYDELKKQELEHFDNWASIYGEKITTIALAPEGTGYRAKTSFARFHNLPELMSMFKEVADIQTAETLNLPTPEYEKINVVVNPSEIQENMVKKLGERADKIRGGSVDASIDNMLKITNEGRKLALDQRLMNPLLPDAETSKLKSCADNIFKIWNDNMETKATQLVFCDLSTPKSYKTKEELLSDEYKFEDIYNDLKRKLILKGIPESEIKFIHEADNEVKKKELFSKVRSGEVRVLIGSTSKMGAGTNVQDKLIAVHHLDCAWKPSSLTQRNGRMIRQGNENKKVYVYSYVTERTFDAYMYQLVEQKQKFISQIMTSKAPSRTMEDIDEKALSYGEIKALATGNPKILEKVNLETEISKLKLLQQSFLNQKYTMQDKAIRYYPEEITRLENKIAAMEEDTLRLQDYTKPNKDDFSPMIINGIKYTDKKEAGKKLLEQIQILKSMEVKKIGEYRGFKMEICFDSFNQEINLKLKNKYSYTIDLGVDALGNITRINNCLENIEKDIPLERDRLDNTKLQLENAKIESEKEFPQEQELKEKQKQLDEINAELNIKDNDHEMFDNETEEKPDKDKDKNSPERS